MWWKNTVSTTCTPPLNHLLILQALHQQYHRYIPQNNFSLESSTTYQNSCIKVFLLPTINLCLTWTTLTHKIGHDACVPHKVPVIPQYFHSCGRWHRQGGLYKPRCLHWWPLGDLVRLLWGGVYQPPTNILSKPCLHPQFIFQEIPHW